MKFTENKMIIPLVVALLIAMLFFLYAMYVYKNKSIISTPRATQQQIVTNNVSAGPVGTSTVSESDIQATTEPTSEEIKEVKAQTQLIIQEIETPMTQQEIEQELERQARESAEEIPAPLVVETVNLDTKLDAASLEAAPLR